MPERGELYFIEIPGDPHERPIPVAVVSIDARNRYGDDVLIIPFSSSPKRYETHLEFPPGETGLPQRSIAKCENITMVEKSLFAGKRPVSTRRLSERRISQMADLVALAMGIKR